jgi:hypothetical protein
LTQHVNRGFLARKKKFDLGPVGKSHFLLKCGRFTDEQRRWVLGPSQGDLEQYDSIYKAAFTMPESIASQWASYVDMSPEEFEYLTEILEDLEVYYSEMGGDDAYWGDAEEEYEDSEVTPSMSASQAESSPMEQAMLVDEESDGNTDDDQARPDAFMQMRKSKRDFKRTKGQPLRSRGKGGKGGARRFLSPPSSQGSGKGGTGGSGFTP